MSTILLVEDNPHIMKINAEVLSLHGYEVLRASTAAEAREQLAWHRVHLIVLDILLPDGNGLELCRELKGQYAIPILFLTALGENRDVVEGLRAGGAAHVWNVEAATEETDKHCTVCGYVAEAQLGYTHKGSRVDGEDATCTEAGSRAYYVCKCDMAFEDEACTKPIADLDSWKAISALGHDFANGKCTVCGAKDPDYAPAVTGGGQDSPQTGGSGVAPWLAVLLLSGGVLGALAVRRTRKKRN